MSKKTYDQLLNESIEEAKIAQNKRRSITRNAAMLLGITVMIVGYLHLLTVFYSIAVAGRICISEPNKMILGMEMVLLTITAPCILYVLSTILSTMRGRILYERRQH